MKKNVNEFKKFHFNTMKAFFKPFFLDLFLLLKKISSWPVSAALPDRTVKASVTITRC